MKQFKIKFTGRKLGAIGVFENQTVIVEAPNRHLARVKLYDSFQDIFAATIQVLPNGPVRDFFYTGIEED